MLGFHGVDVEFDKVHEFVIAHGREEFFGAFVEERVGEVLLVHNHFVDFLFEGAAADELMDEDIAFLSDAVGAVGGLIFDGGVPPAIKVYDLAGCGEIEARAGGLKGEHKEGGAIVGLERLDEFGALFDGRTSVEDEPRATKTMGE